MRSVEKTRKEIEAKLVGMGDYVRIGYLTQCLKNPLDFDTRKFVLLTLTQLYESLKMFSDAGKCIRNAAEVEALTSAKIQDYVKSADFFIRAGNYDDAELSSKKAQAIAPTPSFRENIKRSITDFYKKQSEVYVKGEKRKQAAEVYEKLLSMEISTTEKEQIQQKLLVLYEKLGKIREFYSMKNRNFKAEPKVLEKEEKEETDIATLLDL